MNELLTPNADSPIMDVRQVIELEKRIESQGTPLLSLMERAGAALAHACMEQCRQGERILIICGSGNNGGDGWVAARLLEESGFTVGIITPKPAKQIAAQPAGQAALYTSERFRGDIIVTDEAIPEQLLEGNGVIVDCILGTGFDADQVKEPYARWILQVNAANAFKIACDSPSGLSAQTGKAAECCFKADLTVTMLALKTGLVNPAAKAFTGQVLLAPLGIR